MNTEDYVSYPIAIALKKAGFDWECDHYYTNGYVNDNPEDISRVVKLHNGRLYNHNMVISSDGECVSAPTLWQAQKWLREVHSLHVDISTHGKNYWTTCITGFNDEYIPVGYLHPVNAQAFDNYESALSAGIAAALELIEKKKT